MNNKSLLVIFSLFLFGCDNSNLTNNIKPSSSPSLVVVSEPPKVIMTSSTPEPQIIRPYNMSNIDFDNNFELAQHVPLANGFSAKINNQGNGLLIFKGFAVKIINFKASSERNIIVDEFDTSTLDLDENGNGILSLSPPLYAVPASFKTNSINYGYKYKKVKNFDISTETFNTDPRLENNIKPNDKKDSLYKNLKSSESITIDDYGNGIIIRSVVNASSFKTSIIKDYIIQDKQSIISPQKNLMNNSPATLKVQMDKNGNGYVSWNYDYKLDGPFSSGEYNSEVIVKKLQNYVPVGDEMSLGADYFGGQIIIDKNGNGFIAWQKEFGASYTKVRKINNFIPENKAYDLSFTPPQSSGIFLSRYYLNVLKNNFGDGLLIWQEFNNNGNSSLNSPYETICYARAFENYNISTKNLNATIPMPSPTPYPTAFPSNPPPDQPAPTPTMIPAEIVTISGIVYDQNKNTIDDAEVKIDILSANRVEIPIEKTIGGRFLFRNLPLGDINITVTKLGYQTKIRRVTILSNQQGSPDINQFNFGGDNLVDKNYFIEK